MVLRYIFAVRKGGAIAHPDSYREVEQWTENPCVPVPIAIGTIPGDKKIEHTCRYKSMMEIICYIIYSESIDRYYIGYTTDIDERLLLHNTGHFGGKSYTFKATDWVIFLLITCESIEQAVFVEARIKKMKSRKYITDLLKYPEMIERLKNDFNK